jgi:aryl-alcohol dehydrogenase-like predicted oxidoreductase
VEYGTLGPSGIRVSRLALATSGFGTTVDERTARQLLEVFIASGGTLIDAADVYADGTCEIWVGRWLHDHPEVRSRVVLLTKGRSPVRGQPGASLSPRYLRGALDASLRRLDVDQIDVYQVHGPDRSGSLEELAGFFAEIVSAGKVRAVGVCNFPGWQLSKLACLCGGQGAARLSALQVQYSLLTREVEWEVLPAAGDAHVDAVVWGALGAGLLDNVAGTAGPRHPWEPADSARVPAVTKVVREVACGLDLSVEDVAIAWAGHRPGVTATIVGAPDPGLLRRRLRAADIHLDATTMRCLDQASKPTMPAYPYGFIDWFSDT